MSPIGRLFIILNLILAAAFIAYAGFYLKNQTSFKKTLNEQVAAAQAEKASLDEQISKLVGQGQQYSTDLTTKTNQNANLKVTVKALEEADTDNKSKLARLTAKLEAIEGSVGNVATTLEQQMSRIESLTKDWVAANEEKLKAVGSRDDIQNKLNAVEASLEKANARNESLVADLNAASSEQRELETQIAVIRKAIPSVEDIIKGSQPQVDGTIMTVTPALRSVTISLGESSGVTPGMSFSVHNGTTYKGEIRITEVSDNIAFGRIENAVASQKISKGDKATTRLGTR